MRGVTRKNNSPVRIGYNPSLTDYAAKIGRNPKIDATREDRVDWVYSQKQV